MEYYLIFQLDNPMGEKRFRDFLSREGWQRFSTGVYIHLRRPDREDLWNRAREEFSFDPERDFFAVIESELAFIPTKKYYNKKAPRWPNETGNE